MTDVRLQGRVALVTGAGRRLGRAIAEAIGAQGARVAVHYNHSEDEAAQTKRVIESVGGEAKLFGADLMNPSAPSQLIDAVVNHYGALDILVNSAAIMERTPLGEVTVDSWDAMFALNLRAPFFLAQAASPHLRAARGGGAVVNIADLAAFEAWPAYVPHSITKAGVVQMTRALARALAPEIRVNGVAPGVALLPEGWDAESAEHLRSTTPLKRLGTPDDITGAVLFLLESDYITGETVIVDGGRHVR